ncbi:DUF5753 domain-containing protein [Streptomyces sp. RK75]|uniref:DUF5753 domain-containing protein n=1 Tax=Streptomyces sp. RK75 TaxID=2824895 RepID=UPI001B37FE83|nr:DUF5753 domain-containing protein [Streptomyces sp. RK75]MBQ0867409.1 XRE family transcriptional regulator [Streptomyces sp. RK75]
MADHNDDFDALLEKTSLGTHGARQLRARTTATRAHAARAMVAGWHSYLDLEPGPFQIYVALEGAASLLRVYEAHWVPGLLQTEAYARAIIRKGLGEVGVEKSVAERMKRQQRLLAETAHTLHFVVDEAALYRTHGDRMMMRGQLQHLIDMSEWENVRLQITPFSSGGHGGAWGAFTILSFSDSDLTDVVYVEQLTSTLFQDKQWEVAQYDNAMRQLQQDSLGQNESRDLLSGLLQRI